MTLAERKKEFFRQNPNLRIEGWDERDYELWSAIQQLPSYEFSGGRNFVSRIDVINAIKEAAKKRFRELDSRASGVRK